MQYTNPLNTGEFDHTNASYGAYGRVNLEPGSTDGAESYFRAAGRAGDRCHGFNAQVSATAGLDEATINIGFIVNNNNYIAAQSANLNDWRGVVVDSGTKVTDEPLGVSHSESETYEGAATCVPTTGRYRVGIKRASAGNSQRRYAVADNLTADIGNPAVCGVWVANDATVSSSQSAAVFRWDFAYAT